MPRYYFDLCDNAGNIVDEEGLDLRDIEAVQDEAARALGGMARDAAAILHGGGAEQMEIAVRDESGPVMTVRFAFEISRERRS
ncbi:hypothetical protein FDV58_16700 [Bradyrhizobium elkanii]|uniref:DUF6894 domain-containing protein n=2 Tax=Nitrobacteraceae TaxID=41294 RepID=A0A4U6S1C5_BRAEL|nr:hypothetical protein [Bradyrhizobium sp. BR2003]TKV80563.1 hypothetical protein FDV58_16700 [Bradyrhizobium elkanii]